MYPGIVCAYFIALFCIVIFFAILCKEVHQRWTSTVNIVDVADSRPAINIDEASAAALTQDEIDLTLESPTRQLLYEAREKIHEFEEKIVDLEREGKIPKLGLRSRREDDTTRARTVSTSNQKSSDSLVNSRGEANDVE